MYASPTNRVNMYTSRKAGSTANGHGPHACGPYERPERGWLPNRRQVSGRFARLRTRAGFQNGSPDEPCRVRRKFRVNVSNLPRLQAYTFSGDPIRPPGFPKGPAGPFGRAPRLGISGGFFASFLPGQKGRGMASEETKSYRAEPGAATLPENVLIRQTSTAGSRPRPTGCRKIAGQTGSLTPFSGGSRCGRPFRYCRTSAVCGAAA